MCVCVCVCVHVRGRISSWRHLQVTGCIKQKVAGLEVSMEDIGRVDVLESSQDLVEEVTHMVVAEVLGFEQFVQICLHQSLNDVTSH